MASLDHIALNVTNFAVSKAFYEKALAPLSITAILSFERSCGFGRDGKPDFFVGTGTASFQAKEQLQPITPVHVCFLARSRAEVDAFYEAAIGAGGRDFGAPGLRPHYHPNYYGAFVLDPDGHNIEAVYHR